VTACFCAAGSYSGPLFQDMETLMATETERLESAQKILLDAIERDDLFAVGQVFGLAQFARLRGFNPIGSMLDAMEVVRERKGRLVDDLTRQFEQSLKEKNWDSDLGGSFETQKVFASFEEIIRKLFAENGNGHSS
jgi:hypothetical protein